MRFGFPHVPISTILCRSAAAGDAFKLGALSSLSSWLAVRWILFSHQGGMVISMVSHLPSLDQRSRSQICAPAPRSGAAADWSDWRRPSAADQRRLGLCTAAGSWATISPAVRGSSQGEGSSHSPYSHTNISNWIGHRGEGRRWPALLGFIPISQNSDGCICVSKSLQTILLDYASKETHRWKLIMCFCVGV